MAAGSRDARYFAVLLRAWPRGMAKTQPAKTLANPKLQALYMDQVSTRNESLPNPVALDLCLALFGETFSELQAGGQLRVLIEDLLGGVEAWWARTPSIPCSHAYSTPTIN